MHKGDCNTDEKSDIGHKDNDINQSHNDVPTSDQGETTQDNIHNHMDNQDNNTEDTSQEYDNFEGNDAEKNNIMQQQNIENILQSLQNLLSAKEDDFSDDLGTTLRNAVTDTCNQNPYRCIQVAVVGETICQPLSQDALTDARQATTALRTRLQALMQSMRSIRNSTSFVGKLNQHKLHTLAIGNTKIFLRKGERIGVNTAVHILLDTSGSMEGTRIQLAGKACYATVSALYGIRGISVGVTAFPAQITNADPFQYDTSQSIAPLLYHNSKPHTRFDLQGSGDTPMASSLWWILQQMYYLPEQRKIVLLITDGQPNDIYGTKAAIQSLQSYGIEIFGIGIETNSIYNLLPDKNCKKIEKINDLAPAMFYILQDALIGHYQ
jgi:cobalamin biosynthesis protein CobT